MTTIPPMLSNMSLQYPTAHFESPVLPRIANKTSHADVMWEIVEDSQLESVPTSDIHFVIVIHSDNFTLA